MSGSTIDLATLWLMFGYIGTNWGTTNTCEMPQAQFDLAVNLQVQRDPNYGLYYAQATTEYWVLYNLYGNTQLALEELFIQNQLPNPNLPNVANYVLLEFMRWNVAFSGFQTFNYANYNGWMGGGSYLTVPPPYRALPVSIVVVGPSGTSAQKGVQHG